MSGVLDRAKAHYASLPRMDIRIPEWNATITWTPLTVADHDKIYATDSDGRIVSGGTVRIRTVIQKACDENGKRLFDGMSEKELRHDVSGDIIGRIANAILFGAGLTDAAGGAVAVSGQVEDSKNV